MSKVAPALVMEAASDDDWEVAAVLAKGLGQEFSFGSIEKMLTPNGGTQTSSNSPRRSSTVLTNHSRGNTATESLSQTHYDSIHQQAAKGELEALKQVIDDQQLDERDENGLTPLMWAAMYGQADVVAFLVKAGANVELSATGGNTALMSACYHGNTEVAKCLVSCHLDINQTDEEGNTALMYAVFGNQTECTRILLEKGADVTLRNNQGVASMEAAVKLHHKHVQKAIDQYLLKVLDQP